MKRISVVLCIAFFSFGIGHASVGLLINKKSNEKTKMTLSDTKTRLDDADFWEKDNEDPDQEQAVKNQFSEDDWHLYAPPPGEDGNPQKIAPLGNYDIAALLLLSVLSLLYFRSKKMIAE